MTAAAPPSTSLEDRAPEWQVFCLCAAWCGVCGQWRTLFDQLAAQHPAMRFTWIDIEDEAQALGDVDVETFPTLLVAQADRVRFHGPVLPSLAQARRLLASLQTDPAALAAGEEAGALLRRLKALQTG
jgi:hypothetical protein